MKKKIIAVSLITAMVICNSMTVWAADIYDNDGYKQGTEGSDNADRVENNSGVKDVTATFGLGTVAEVYNVEISWGSMEFTPDGTLQGTWVEDGYYSVSGHAGAWKNDTGANNITITNKSNVDITATFTPVISPDFLNDYVVSSKHANSHLTVARTSGDIDCALTSANNTLGNTVAVIATIGRAPDAEVKRVTLGTVTVTIEKKE